MVTCYPFYVVNRVHVSTVRLHRGKLTKCIYGSKNDKFTDMRDLIQKAEFTFLLTLTVAGLLWPLFNLTTA